jgi:SAM-dependent MidA family methyltransferase
VDLTHLRRVGEALGLTTVLETTQRDLLLGLGLRDWLSRLDPARLTAADLFNAKAAASELVDPSRLGKFRVLVQAKGVAADPALLGAQPGTK